MCVFFVRKPWHPHAHLPCSGRIYTLSYIQIFLPAQYSACQKTRETVVSFSWYTEQKVETKSLSGEKWQSRKNVAEACILFSKRFFCYTFGMHQRKLLDDYFFGIWPRSFLSTLPKHPPCFFFFFLFSPGIPFPTPLKSIPKVEQQNNLVINVFGYEEFVFPVYLSSRVGSPINLLLISKVIDGETKTHYVWIKDIDRLLYDQNKHANRKHFCLRCLFSFNSEESLSKHTPECKRVSAGEPARVSMPTDPSLKFVNHAKMMKAPFLIYADSEAIVTPHENDGGNTTRDSKHVPCSVGFVVVRSDGKKTREWFYRGEDCIEKFYRELEDVRRFRYVALSCVACFRCCFSHDFRLDSKFVSGVASPMTFG